MSYDRYAAFRKNGNFLTLPTIEIEESTSDIHIQYDRTRMRFDLLSYKYYGDANYGWLILSANPQYGSMEFEIPNNVILRIPYPLPSALNRYETKVNEWLSEHKRNNY